MPNVVRFPGERTVTLKSDPADEHARWAVQCSCGSTHFQIYACGEIACSVCDGIPHDEDRGDARAYRTLEFMLQSRTAMQTIRFEDPEPEAGQR